VSPDTKANGNPAPDHNKSGPVARLGTIVDRLAIGTNAAGTFVVLGLVAIVCADVVARNIFSSPFRGIIEAVEFALVLIVFLQLADVVRVNRLTRSDGFLMVLQSKNPLLGNVLSRVFDLISAIFMIFIIIIFLPETIAAYEDGDFFGTPGIFTAPKWPVYAVIVIGCSLCAARWLLNLITGRQISDVRAAENDDEI